MKTEGDIPDNYVNFYIQVDDLDDLQVSLDSAVAKGGQIGMPPTPIPEMGAYAIFADPAGNTIGILKEQVSKTYTKSKPIKNTEGVANMAECRGPLARTLVYKIEPSTKHRIRFEGSVGSTDKLPRTHCNASRKARPRIGAPADRRTLRCLLGI